MRNTLGDLNNHLFEALERLNDEDLQGEKLTEEINRSKAMTSVAMMIIENANTVLKARRIYDEKVNADAVMPRMLEG